MEDRIASGVGGNLSRREFVRTAAAVTAVAAGGLLPGRAEAVGQGGALREAAGAGLVDTNISLGRWPCRRLPLDEVSALVAKLRSLGVKEAWAGSFDGLLSKDLAAVNARLTEECRKHGRGMLMPFGSVNPTLPAWEEDLRRCREEHRMPGIRLHPNYHGYKLDDPAFARLLDLASGCGLIVQLVVTMEDERTQQHLMRLPHVDVAPLLDLLSSRPSARLVLLNWFRGVKGALLPKLAAAGQICFDIATQEGVGGVANLFKQVPSDRVLFGSHAPFFYFESALLKLKESVMSEGDLGAVRSGNARRLLRREGERPREP
jgi:uncharacterized protein